MLDGRDGERGIGYWETRAGKFVGHEKETEEEAKVKGGLPATVSPKMLGIEWGFGAFQFTLDGGRSGDGLGGVSGMGGRGTERGGRIGCKQTSYHRCGSEIVGV